MNNKKHRVMIIIIAISLPILLIIFIVGVLNNQTDQQFATFTDLMAIQDMNNSIQVSYFPFDNSRIDEKRLTIELRNQSNSRIEFPVGWGMRLFINKGSSENWIEIKNGMTYSSYNNNNPILAAENSDNLAQRDLIDILPVLQNSNFPVTIRVFITGRVLYFLSTPGRAVGAYIDISIQQ